MGAISGVKAAWKGGWKFVKGAFTLGGKAAEAGSTLADVLVDYAQDTKDAYKASRPTKAIAKRNDAIAEGYDQYANSIERLNESLTNLREVIDNIDPENLSIILATNDAHIQEQFGDLAEKQNSGKVSLAEQAVLNVQTLLQGGSAASGRSENNSFAQEQSQQESGDDNIGEDGQPISGTIS